MKITKTLRQIVGVLAVGTALALTGSAARAQSSGVEGNCPKDTCYFRQTCQPTPPDANNPSLSWGEVANGSRPEPGGCRDCDGVKDAEGYCVSREVTFTVSYFKCYVLDAEHPELPPVEKVGTIAYEKKATSYGAICKRVKPT